MEIEEIIYKKLTGSANQEELIHLVEWVKKDEKNQSIFHEMETHWKGKEGKLAQVKKDTWADLEVSIAKDFENGHLGYQKITTTKYFWNFQNFRAIAASLFLVVFFSIIWVFMFNNKSNYANNPETVEFITKYNPLGVKSNIILPDKSKVKLNSNSKITFPKVFKGEVREVYLEGEAFFEVQKMPERPFIVKTGSLTTEVKGTSFNIKAYDIEKDIKVAVVSGLVSVYNNDDGIFIHPGEMVEYNTGKGEEEPLTTRNFQPEDIAWKDGIIIFSSSSFEEVCDIIQSWYGMEIIKKKEVQFKEGFTGEFQNESLEMIMKSLAFSGNFKYQIDRKNNQLIIW